MNKSIIDNWNRVVTSSDTVYHLGDFSFGDPKPYRKMLKGRIVLILGNHDKCLNQYSSIFNEVYNLHYIKIENTFITLCHFAMRV